MTWEEISANNLIILGSAKYSPQIRDLPLRQTFIVEQNGVTNLHPRSGEPAKFLRRYTQDEDRNIIEEYAVISRLPGVNGRGSIVVLGASATEGTDAAVQYVTHPVHSAIYSATSMTVPATFRSISKWWSGCSSDRWFRSPPSIKRIVK